MKERVDLWSEDYNPSKEQIKFLKEFTDKRIIKLIDDLMLTDKTKNSLSEKLSEHKLSLRNECLKLCSSNKLTHEDASIITNRFTNMTSSLLVDGEIQTVYLKLGKKNRQLVKNKPE